LWGPACTESYTCGADQDNRAKKRVEKMSVDIPLLTRQLVVVVVVVLRMPSQSRC
jgi:hypothetical protein